MSREIDDESYPFFSTLTITFSRCFELQCIASTLRLLTYADNQLMKLVYRFWTDERTVPVFATLISAMMLLIYGALSLWKNQGRHKDYIPPRQAQPDASDIGHQPGIGRLVRAHCGWARLMLLAAQSAFSIALLLLSVLSLCSAKKHDNEETLHIEIANTCLLVRFINLILVFVTIDYWLAIYFTFELGLFQYHT
jgi:hypothetical protein